MTEAQETMQNNNLLVGGKINGGNSQGKRNASDFYATPPSATIALMKWLDLFPKTFIWEPACGEGAISKVLDSFGMRVSSTDINDFGYGFSGIDFLNIGESVFETNVKESCEWIITNPPYKLASDFIEVCRGTGKPFALLLKSQFWHAKTRTDLFRKHPPSYILALNWRPPFNGGSPLMDFSWNIWEAGNGMLHGRTQYLILDKPTRGD